MKVKEESQKVGLKPNIQKTKVMAFGPIPSQQIDRETMETMSDFIFGAPKSLQMVTVAMKLKNTCSLEESYDQPAAAAAAKSLQLCPTLCDPRDSSPPGSPVPGILKAITLSSTYSWNYFSKAKI